MNISYRDMPIPHVLIDDFLPDKAAKKCLEEFISYEPYYIDAAVNECQCDDCQESAKICQRDNKIFYLDGKVKPNKSDIIKSVHHALFKTPLTNFLGELGGLFPIIQTCTTTESILSRYGKCDFYGVHTDQMSEKPQTRLLTVVFYVNKENAKFTGGDLNLYDKKGASYISIKPRHNRCVIFESRMLHSVSSVGLNEESFDEGRFSLNFWLGFDGNLRWREELG